MLMIFNPHETYETHILISSVFTDRVNEPLRSSFSMAIGLVSENPGR